MQEVIYADVGPLSNVTASHQVAQDFLVTDDKVEYAEINHRDDIGESSQCHTFQGSTFSR